MNTYNFPVNRPDYNEHNSCRSSTIGGVRPCTREHMWISTFFIISWYKSPALFLDLCMFTCYACSFWRTWSYVHCLCWTHIYSWAYVNSFPFFVSWHKWPALLFRSMYFYLCSHVMYVQALGFFFAYEKMENSMFFWQFFF